MVTKQKLSDFQRKNIRAAAETIMDNFCWMDTQWGSEFWDAVYENLILLSDARSTCGSCGQELPE